MSNFRLTSICTMIALLGNITPGANAATAFDISTAQIITDHVMLRTTAGGATSVTFQPADWPHILYKAPIPWDWSQSGGLQVTVKNPGNTAITFMIRVDDDLSSDGYHHSRSGSATISAHQTVTYTMPYDQDPMKFGVKGLPVQPHSVAIPPQGPGTFNLAHIVQFQIFLSHPHHDHTLVVSDIHLVPQLSLNDVVDQFGQYTGTTWPGKITNTAQLNEDRQAEKIWLDKHKSLPGRDRFGGWAEGPTLSKTGYFHTVMYHGKWSLVDPEGHLFLSFGTDCVQDQYPTFLTGRASWFSHLPPASSPLARFYGSSTAFMGPIKQGKTFDFFRANLYRKYGANYRAIWFALALKRLRAWGFNTIGNWSDPVTFGAHKVPFVVTTGVPSTTKVSSGSDYWGEMADPFDPQFAINAKAAISAAMSPYKNDRWCIGAFVDNELSWAGPGTRGQYGLAIGAMAESASASPAKRAFLKELKSRYTTIAAFNVAWGTDLPNWSALEAPFTVPAVLPPPAINDCKTFVKAFADQYFKVVSSSFHAVAPNHLYLGCRFAWYSHDEAREAAKYCDVVSFNIYQPAIKKDQWAWLSELHKPCIIGEFHSGALDRGMWMPGLILEPNQAARAHMFAQYVKSVAQNPAFVGCHWFQFVDEPLTGRTWDGENYNIGFLSCTDRPYREMVASARKVLANVYQLRYPTAVKPTTNRKRAGEIVAEPVSSTYSSAPGIH